MTGRRARTGRGWDAKPPSPPRRAAQPRDDFGASGELDWSDVPSARAADPSTPDAQHDAPEVWDEPVLRAPARRAKKDGPAGWGVDPADFLASRRAASTPDDRAEGDEPSSHDPSGSSGAPARRAVERLIRGDLELPASGDADSAHAAQPAARLAGRAVERLVRGDLELPASGDADSAHAAQSTAGPASWAEFLGESETASARAGNDRKPQRRTPDRAVERLMRGELKPTASWDADFGASRGASLSDDDAELGAGAASSSSDDSEPGRDKPARRPARRRPASSLPAGDDSPAGTATSDGDEPGARPAGRSLPWSDRPGGKERSSRSARGADEDGMSRGLPWSDRPGGNERSSRSARGAGEDGMPRGLPWSDRPVAGSSDRDGGRAAGGARGRGRWERGEDGLTPRERRRKEREEAEAKRDPYERAREICLRQLAVRPRTRQELAKALSKHNIEQDVADAVLERYDEVGIIDDAAFARAWVSSRHHGKGLATRALAQELRRRGVDQEVAEEALSQLDADTEAATAADLARRKLRTMRGEPDAIFRRLVGMLARKGYSGGVAVRAVKDALAERDSELADMIDPDLYEE